MVEARRIPRMDGDTRRIEIWTSNSPGQMAHLRQIIDWRYHLLVVQVGEKGNEMGNPRRLAESARGPGHEMAGQHLDSLGCARNVVNP